VPAANAPAVSEKKEDKSSGSSGKMDDITITGEDKLKVKTDKPFIEIKMDINEVVKSTIETERKFLEKSPKLINLQESVPKTLISSQTAMPYLTAIIREPIARFSLKILGVKVNTWEFIVTDSKGKVFKKFTGKGAPPPFIEWSGRNPDNKVVKVGNTYSYLVNTMDEAGNPRTLIGSPFVINSLLHQEEDGLYVSISRKKLFEIERNRTKFIEDNVPLLKETSDYIKENHNLITRIDVYGENQPLALEQAKTAAKYFTDELILPADYLKFNGYEDIVENHRIDIVIKNR
jgi:hypothetical protein